MIHVRLVKEDNRNNFLVIAFATLWSMTRSRVIASKQEASDSLQ
ncbi:hypothetical protein T01_13114 [Trichinella spiralis]|uniref:Uncharacterized protein n=1 Tax=Trichinella spiralis TaxID=6334 RepID=A0A0V0YTL4_TRISP|nr:hypothetical protein T01_2229 [Trichinella spiralis]KRY06207.1 hypothetical protein T01_13114 [Trichinella spiralis]